MPTNFPTSVDNFTNPTANDSLNLPSHSTQHANSNDAIEAIEGYLLNGAGKNIIARTSFSAQTTVSFSSIFTNTFDNYKILINIEAASTANTLLLRLRSGTTDNSGANYNRQELTANSVTVIAGQGGSQNAFLAGKYDVAGGASEVTLFNPNEPQYTYITSVGVSPTSTVTLVNSTGYFTTTSEFDGFSVVAAGGNITGTIKVYGLRKTL
jgi:hypothetical protein